MRRPARLAVAVLAALAACKDDAPAGAPPGAAPPAGAGAAAAGATQDACELVTREEAAAALGRPVKAPRADATAAMGQTRCVFAAEADTSAKLVQLALVQTRGMPAGMRRGTPDAATFFRNTRAGYDDAKAVAGLGDEAFSSGLGLHVLRGDAYLTVLVGSLTGHDEQAEERLARQALARLR